MVEVLSISKFQYKIGSEGDKSYKKTIYSHMPVRLIMKMKEITE